MPVDPTAVTAIDVHVHVHASVSANESEDGGGERLEAMAKYFRSEGVTANTAPDIAAYYRERNMAAVVFTVDNANGNQPGSPSNEEIARLAHEHDDVLIPFASVDPRRGAEGVAMAKDLIANHGVRGFKFHPNGQAFFPNDRDVYPLYEVIAEAGLISLFHTGHSGAGAGQRGGAGFRLKYSNPMHLDDVAVDFPDMPIIMAHPSFPWQDEAISVALHKPNAYIDLSGWSPKYFSPNLIQYANTLLREKVLFGSDYPLITPDRWMRDFDNQSFRDEVRPLILKENAAKLFGLV